MTDAMAATADAEVPVPDDVVGPTPRSQIRMRTRSGASAAANSTLVPSGNIGCVAKAGPNELEVKVVDLWVNRMIGDEQLPEDSDRNDNGTLKAWAKWLQEGKPSPTGRLTFTSWRLWKKDAPLQPSGLIGPVTLRSVARVELSAK